MKILFIAADSNPFYKLAGGGSQRTYLLIEALAQCASVDIAIFAEDAVSNIPNTTVVFSKFISLQRRGYDSRMKKMKPLLHPFDPYAYYPVIDRAAKEMHRIIEQGDYDFICVRYVETIFNCGLMRYADKLIVDVDDYPVDDMVKQANVAPTLRSKLYYLILSRIMTHSIPRVINQCRYAFTPTTPRWSNPRTSRLPNVPFYNTTQFNSLENHIQPCLLFVGGLSFPPNRNGVEHFLQHVYNRVLQEIPDVQFHIIGTCPDEDLKREIESYPNVVVKGYVDDLIKEYKECDICIAPMYAGAGTNIKVIEALQMGRPCVITPIAYRGYELLVNGKDLIVAYNDTQYAESVISLLKDPQSMVNMAKNGYKKYQKYFSKEYFFKVVKDAIEQISK